MCPAACTRDRVANNDAVVASIGVGQKNLIVIFQKSIGSITSSIEREVEDVIRMPLIANVDPHARIGGFIFRLHRHEVKS
jgi:hypothetical protein